MAASPRSKTPPAVPAVGLPAEARRLEALRPRFEALNAARIRAEGEVGRLERELDAARAAARDLFGTDDAEAIARMVEADAARDAAAIAALDAKLDEIAARLDAAEAEA